MNQQAAHTVPTPGNSSTPAPPPLPVHESTRLGYRLATLLFPFDFPQAQPCTAVFFQLGGLIPTAGGAPAYTIRNLIPPPLHYQPPNSLPFSYPSIRRDSSLARS